MADTEASPPATSIRLAALQLSDFRNHATLDLDSDARLIVITGPNGAGKTNILEAVSLMVPGRGLRRAPLAQMARQAGDGGFAVSARLEPGDTRIGTGIRPDAPGRRVVRINGAEATANSLGEWLAAIWLTPAMDRLFVEGAGDRRRFLDRLVLALEPGHARISNAYEAAMRERNRLLTDGTGADAAWFDAIEARMAESGARIIDSRRRLIDALEPWLSQASDGPFARARIALCDRSSSNEPLPAEPDGLVGLWRSARAQDAAAGRTLHGPHRADLDVFHAETGQAAALCSTGEQKALLLSIVLAHAELVRETRRQTPLLLLDEVAAHLDARRRAALVERLDALGGQVWMTGTDRSLFDAARGNDALFLDLPGIATP